MNYSRWHYQNIALAAVAQCAMMVDRLAETGQADTSLMNACINPLLILNPSNIAEVYPSVYEFRPGLRSVQEIFSNEKMERNNEIVRYVLGMLALRSRLMSNEAMQQHIRQKLGTIPRQESGETGDQQFYQSLANVYQQTISTFSFRIHVKGKVEFLKDEFIANRIRALLLAGIRSAVLWYQLGGRRWQLLVYRKKIRETVKDISRNLITKG
ncbi:MAG: high frequency lysogenization protein HflD [Pseudohongiellaceae bacterium]